MARMGHDSECAAMIYQHEVRGADRAITDAINTHVQAERDNTRAAAARLACSPRSANGPLMARKIIRVLRANSRQTQSNRLTCINGVERVTRIELELSAWESERNRPSWRLTCQLVCPVMAALRRS
jgi:hypothetical protein